MLPKPFWAMSSLPPPGEGHLTLCHRTRRQFLRRVVCCQARYSSTRAQACVVLGVPVVRDLILAGQVEQNGHTVGEGRT